MSEYVFIKKDELESLKNRIELIENIKHKPKKEASNAPLWWALFFLFWTVVLGACYRNTQWFYVPVVIGVVATQTCIDLFKGESRPIWSAVFRVVALFVWITLVDQLVLKVWVHNHPI